MALFRPALVCHRRSHKANINMSVKYETAHGLFVIVVLTAFLADVKAEDLFMKQACTRLSTLDLSMMTMSEIREEFRKVWRDKVQYSQTDGFRKAFQRSVQKLYANDPGAVADMQTAISYCK